MLEELRMHLAWRWLTGLGFEQEIPYHSTFSKNRHGRFQQGDKDKLLKFMSAKAQVTGRLDGSTLEVETIGRAVKGE